MPARGQATVTITVKAVAGKVGDYAGVLGAASADGKITVRTPVGVYEEPERYDLTATIKDRTGADSPEGYHQLVAVNLDTGDVFQGVSGAKLRITPGRYTCSPTSRRHDPAWSPRSRSWPTRRSRSPATPPLAFDARTGKRVSMAIDQPAAKGGARAVTHEVTPVGMPEPFTFSTGLDPRFHEIYAASTPGVRSSVYAFANWLHAVEPDIDLTATAPQRFPVAAGWLGLPNPELDVALGAVHGGAGTPAELAKVDAKGKLVTLALPDDLSWEDVVVRLANVKAAGGRIALAVAVEPASLLRSPSAAAPAPDDFAVPTLIGFGDTALRFVESTKKPGVTTKLVTKQASRYRYEVSANSPGSIPAALNYDRKTKDLAAVKARYFGHPGLPGTRANLAAMVVGDRLVTAYVWDTQPTATERIEYFTPGRWELASENLDNYPDSLFGHVADFKVGTPSTVEWDKAAYAPTFANPFDGEPWARRTGGLIDVTVPFFGDASGHVRLLDSEAEVDTGTTSLYRDGKLVGTLNVPGRGIFPVPYATSTYKLTSTVRRTEPWWPLATSMAATWTFKSDASPDGGTLPLLTVGFQPGLDLRNTAKGGQAFSFPATVVRQAGSGTAAVNGLRVSVSYDDGKTWKAATVARDGATWKVTVTHPASGYVSLRASADDAQGNTVEQTVIRAYRLR